MCAIIGALLHNIKTTYQGGRVRSNIAHIMAMSRERGRDGFGWWYNSLSHSNQHTGEFKNPKPYLGAQLISPYTNLALKRELDVFSFIGNMRAEPTTEYVAEKCLDDQQPYINGPWSVVHNGTIANDQELRTHKLNTTIDSAAIVESLTQHHDLFEGSEHSYANFRHTVERLVGSYAILACHETKPSEIYVACNYRPVWYAETDEGVYFASSSDYFPEYMVPQSIPPYSTARFALHGSTVQKEIHTLYPKIEGRKPRSLVVASGGMDSTVAAQECLRMGHDVELMHFGYGCRAEDHEQESINAIAQAMRVGIKHFPIHLYDPADSRLLDKDSQIAGGEAGAEYAHEWVPARNLLMLSIATAVAEVNGYDYIVLGNNLEEAGAYPDNEPEFIRRFDALLPYAVGDGKRVQVLMPVGNLMKHEIVKMGHANGAPLHLTWSCYKSGEKHCGKCGPCFMRKTAFEINGLPEVIVYETD